MTLSSETQPPGHGRAGRNGHAGYSILRPATHCHRAFLVFRRTPEGSKRTIGEHPLLAHTSKGQIRDEIGSSLHAQCTEKPHHDTTGSERGRPGPGQRGPKTHENKPRTLVPLHLRPAQTDDAKPSAEAWIDPDGRLAVTCWAPLGDNAILRQNVLALMGIGREVAPRHPAPTFQIGKAHRRYRPAEAGPSDLDHFLPDTRRMPVPAAALAGWEMRAMGTGQPRHQVAAGSGARRESRIHRLPAGHA